MCDYMGHLLFASNPSQPHALPAAILLLAMASYFHV